MDSWVSGCNSWHFLSAQLPSWTVPSHIHLDHIYIGMFHQQQLLRGRMSSSASKSISRAKTNLTMIIKTSNRIRLGNRSFLRQFFWTSHHYLWFFSLCLITGNKCRDQSIYILDTDIPIWRNNQLGANEGSRITGLWIWFHSLFFNLTSRDKHIEFRCSKAHRILVDETGVGKVKQPWRKKAISIPILSSSLSAEHPNGFHCNWTKTDSAITENKDWPQKVYITRSIINW